MNNQPIKKRTEAEKKKEAQDKSIKTYFCQYEMEEKTKKEVLERKNKGYEDIIEKIEDGQAASKKAFQCYCLKFDLDYDKIEKDYEESKISVEDDDDELYEVNDIY